MILGAISLYSYPLNFEARYLFLTLASVAVFTYLTGCGFGDSKLALVILGLIVPRTQIFGFVYLLVVASSVLVVLHLIRFRSLRGEIAFAPALCGAVLALSP